MLILFDKNVPNNLRSHLAGHSVSTLIDLGWNPRIENGELIEAGEKAGFDVLITADQNIKYQHNLTNRRISLFILGSNIWPIVEKHVRDIAERVHAATPGSFGFIVMPLPPKPRWPRSQ